MSLSRRFILSINQFLFLRPRALFSMLKTYFHLIIYFCARRSTSVMKVLIFCFGRMKNCPPIARAFLLTEPFCQGRMRLNSQRFDPVTQTMDRLRTYSKERAICLPPLSKLMVNWIFPLFRKLFWNSATFSKLKTSCND